MRRRRPYDAAVAIASFVVLALFATVAVPLSGFEADIAQLIAGLPGFLDPLWRLLGIVAVLWAGWLTVVTLVTRRFDLVRDVALTLLLTGVGAVVCNETVGGDWGHAFAAMNTTTVLAIPSAWLAAAVGVVAVLDPVTTPGPRRVGRWSVTLAAVALVLIGTATPSAVAVALLLGAMAAAIVHLVLTTDAGLPEPSRTAHVLADLGIAVDRLEMIDVRPSGVVQMAGTLDDGREVIVLVVGRDAADTQLLTRAWRLLWYRQGHAISLGRADQMEHRAFVLLWLGSRGIAVPDILAAGADPNGDAVLALADVGRPLVDLRPEDITDQLWDSVWSLVVAMHQCGISHGDLAAGAFSVVDRGSEDLVPVLVNPGPATATTEPRARSIDIAQMIVLGRILIGQERSMRAARVAIGEDQLAEVLPYLQPAALGSTLRDEMSAIPRAERPKVDKIREEVAEALGTEPPTIAGLRRVSGAALARLGLLVLIAYAVITAVSHVDVEEVWNEISNADWAWVAVALILAQFAIAANAVVTQGAAPRRLPYGPLVLLQFTIAFIALAIPSSAARVATVVRFFQKQGTTAASAAAISMVDSVSGFVAQMSILGLVLVVGIGDVELNLSPSDDSGGIDFGALIRLLLLVVALVVVAVVIALVVPKLRHSIVKRVRPWLGDMKEILVTLREPRRLVHLIGGSMIVEVVYAGALGACVFALGGTGITIAEMLVVYIAAALFGGFMPVPGGIGVMEAALAAGLQAVGVDATTAFGCAVVFRLVTFFLPPVWGYAAFTWLQRSGNM